MKIFDRYIIGSFLRNYLLSFIVLVGLYIALDMIFNFDELTRGAMPQGGSAQQTGASLMQVFGIIANIADYYFYQMFAFFVQLSGVIPVTAAAFTLMRMMRFNEMTAMLAAGVPMLRIAAPVIAIGAVMSGLVAIDEELIIPNIAHKLVRQHGEAGQARGAAFPVSGLEDSAGSLLFAGRYTPAGYDRTGALAPPMMQEVDILEFNKDRQPIAATQAREAVYDSKAGAWKLNGGWRQTAMRPRDTIAKATPATEWKTDLGPNEIALYRKSSFVEFLSLSQINSLLEHPRNYGTEPLLRVRHWRLVQPIANVLLLMLAIPCILTREPNAMKAAATKTVLVTGACLAMIFVSHQLAGRSPSPELTWFWPALMLWLPLFIFAPISVYMLENLKS